MRKRWFELRATVSRTCANGCDRFWPRSSARSDSWWTLSAGEKTMKLIDGFDSNYRYILVAARRARQLQGGAPPVIQTPSRKPCRIAQDEIKAGKVKWVIPEIPRTAAEVASEMLEKALAKDV